MTPWDALGAVLTALEGLEGWNVYPTPTNQVSAPAIVLRPDDPWREPHAYCFDQENYLAIAVVQGATPADGMAKLFEGTNAIIGALQSPWEFVSVGVPVIDESTGVPFIAAPVRLRYKSTQEV